MFLYSGDSIAQTGKCVFLLVGVSCFITHPGEEWRAGMKSAEKNTKSLKTQKYS